ncbi:nuclear transport factor 2 family protein [Cupriavidus respiraculi]|uniref:nuclear transport factor 2 family protein n=1 Tax=Cupriavidus respiraculi TaxID=195930 RepID=UPI001C95563F|nr:nuclear transport factor 2 family protein [Cupriavidus respiraculi]MBY4945454.1 nuclear transport factor 2 family protein [Cupriavidus respiraculi]
MSELNKSVLRKANAAVTAGDIEGFLSYCAEDIVWTTVGAETLSGKEAVRKWMVEAYGQPPKFTVDRLIAEEEFVAALGHIMSKDETGKPVTYSYCDVWRFKDGRMVELKAYVIPADE